MSEELSLYIHVPFCIRKCAYCDFYSLEDLDRIPDLVQALKAEIRLCAGDPAVKGSGKKREVATLYFGGGTPSLLPIPAVESLLETIHAVYQIQNRAEITFEVNPGTLDAGYLADLRQVGINRLSMGTQSFDGNKLAFLTRIHTVEDSVQAIEQARKAGFDNVGLDLIYALPGESPESWEKDLETAVRFDPAHLSCYTLTLEPGTPLHRQAGKGAFTPCDTETRAGMFLRTSEFLEQKGFLHYEVSNFSRGLENRSRHNSNYWNMTEYQGMGPSAHSFQRPNRAAPQRSWNLADMTSYIQTLEKGRLPMADREILTRTQQKLEKILLGLRTCHGIDISSYDRDFEADFRNCFGKIILQLQDQGLGEWSKEKAEGGPCFRLTCQGWTCLDSIVETFADQIL